MNLTNNQIQILTSIKAKLVWGDLKAIAEKVGMTDVYVGKVLNPETNSYNEDIVNEAVKLITERERNQKQILNKLSSQSPE